MPVLHSELACQGYYSSHHPKIFMLPTVVSEQTVCSFYFYRNGYICEGMRHDNKLYQLEQVFKSGEQRDAYGLGCRLIRDGHSTMVTTSKRRLKVWRELSQNVSALSASFEPIGEWASGF